MEVCFGAKPYDHFDVGGDNCDHADGDDAAAYADGADFEGRKCFLPKRALDVLFLSCILRRGNDKSPNCKH